jgi:hypothetical protein
LLAVQLCPVDVLPDIELPVTVPEYLVVPTENSMLAPRILAFEIA